MRTAATIGVVALVGAALVRTAPLEPFRQTVSNRFATLVDPGRDVSLRVRTMLVGEYINEIGSNFVGNGLGSTGKSVQLSARPAGIVDFDNGVLEVFFALGWPGATLFVGGMAWLILPLMRRRGSERTDGFAIAARAGGICLLVQAAFGNVFSGAPGAALYTAFGILAASRRWNGQDSLAPSTPRQLPTHKAYIDVQGNGERTHVRTAQNFSGADHAG